MAGRSMNEYTLIERIPTIEEYTLLRRSVGWKILDTEPMKIGLSNSLLSICAVYENKIIGYGRIVGDGGVYFYIQDVIILPEFQKRGIGRCIMNAIMQWLKIHADANAFIGLMAAKGAAEFYEKFGFKKRPQDSPGMFLIYNEIDKGAQFQNSVILDFFR